MCVKGISEVCCTSRTLVFGTTGPLQKSVTVTESMDAYSKLLPDVNWLCKVPISRTGHNCSWRTKLVLVIPAS